MRFISIDTESGGTEPGKHALVSLGIQIVDDIESPDPFLGGGQEWRFARMDGQERKAANRRVYELRALEVSGTTVAMLKNGQPEQAVLRGVRDFITANNAQGLPLVSYNATFDQAMWSDLLFLCGEWNRNANAFVVAPEVFSGPWHCARRMFRCLNPGALTSSLDDALRVYGLARESETHGALADAVVLGELWKRMNP